MKIAASILSVRENLEASILKLGRGSTDYIHLDVVDGRFASNKKEYENVKEILLQAKKPLDVHLMVNDIAYYISIYKEFSPIYMTFHLEVADNPLLFIEQIKSYSKVGISIKPHTEVTAIFPYLDKIDLVLLMSVEPGFGGQSFIDVTDKIEVLKKYRKDHHLSFLIEVDGGINKDTINKVKDADIVVVGSYITNAEDYEKQIRNLKN